MTSIQALGPFAIGERVGSSVWLADDTRNGKRVALKLLSRSLQKDPGRRDAFLREVRVAAALYHAFLVPIQSIEPFGDNLVMIMDVIEGQSLTRRLGGQPLSREEFFRVALQLASVVKYLHVKTLLHGNVNGDAVMITPEGHLRLGGLNLTNLARRDKKSVAYQQKGSDIHCVSYMAPEQIAGQDIDERTDAFSVACVLYQAATGRTPFAGATAADVARSVVEAQPQSPTAINPQIDKSVLGVVGASLFKDPFKRKDMKALVDMIQSADSSAAIFAAQLEKKLTLTPAAAATDRRQSVLLIADVAGGDPDATACMQQILGEAVYLFDGKVIDPFSARLVAELPSIESALEAARKAEFDCAPEQQNGEELPVRLLLHEGELEVQNGAPSGAVIEKAAAVLEQLPPNALFITEAFAKDGRAHVRLRDAGARAGVKLYTIVPPEPVAAAETEVEVTTAELDQEAAEEQAALLAARAAAHKRRMLTAAIAAIVLLAIIAGAAVMWSRRPVPAVAAAAAVPTGPQPATAANPRDVFIAPFTISATDPTLADRAKAIQLGAVEILRTFPELRVVDAATPEATSFSATLRSGPAGAELVPTSGPKSGAPVAILDVASGIRALVQWVTTEVKTQPRTYAAADALNSFADAVVARSANDASRADSSLRAAMASDPNFLPAQLMAMRFFAASGKNADALAAARQVIALDPANLDAARSVARASLAAGDLQQSFAAYNLVLRSQPHDIEALNLIARYSASAGDTARFNSTLQRLTRIPVVQVEAHEPDLIAYAGRIDVAVQRYFAVEEQAPNNPSLSLKIGRLSVLRHSLPIAELELKKLADADPLYGYHMLSAYIAAERQQRDVAAKELERALAANVPGDDSWTSAAEVRAILADTSGIVAALQKAAKRKEPTAAYVLANPLFRYLENDSQIQQLRKTFAEQQAEARAALAQVN